MTRWVERPRDRDLATILQEPQVRESHQISPAAYDAVARVRLVSWLSAEAFERRARLLMGNG